MKGFRADERGQVHTIEGIVSGLILVITLMYIINSITFVSPQTEKTTVMKMSIKAEDIVAVLGTSDQPTDFTSNMTTCLARWNGTEADNDHVIGPGEQSIEWLDGRIRSLLPAYVVFNSTSGGSTSTFAYSKTYALYNLNISYINDAATAALGYPVYDDRMLIFHGEPQENAVMASKIIVLNHKDIYGPGGNWSYWNKTVAPKVVEIKLIIWNV
jgi:hypothetical protein